ncbi:facilitated trehalose transporter Tret1-like [Leguminivora glycinivorella]|uniref:facilitated trehalose transporter Tret1-like n=1 Tax=Leguminivora glycinivorella TaxID=1035111 RepID=UPI002010B481|nr:facilitated trehalose transporter Tret1-like [Leguminivora glycinivorella]XP_047987865.1 facilitated trehalose transporter Tret1-like [Leguminivora glycinivorella]
MKNIYIRQYMVVFAINLNCISFGVGTNWPSPVLAKLLANDTETFDKPLQQDDASWITSISFLTGSLGYVVTSALVDAIGRKQCVILSSAARLAAALLFLFASEVWMLILGRAIIGLSEGILLSVIPVYASEIASKEIRGALGVMLQIFASIGSVIILSVGPFISYFNLSLMFTLISLVTSVPTAFLPDSPNFLYSKGREEESKKVLIFLRGSELIADEELKEYAINKNEEKSSLLTIFRSEMFQKSLGISSFVIIFVYLIGFNCVMLYLQTILDTTKTNIKSEVASGVIGAINLLASFSTLMTTDRFGRKPILISTLLAMLVGMVGLGVFFKLTEMGAEVSGFLNYLPLISIIVVVFSYSGGLGSLLWVVIAELFDDLTRGIGMATTLLIGIVPAFLTMRYFSPLMDILGPAPVFWASGVFCAVLATFVAFRLPETKGKSFAEIQQALRRTSKSSPNI